MTPIAEHTAHRLAKYDELCCLLDDTLELARTTPAPDREALALRAIAAAARLAAWPDELVALVDAEHGRAACRRLANACENRAVIEREIYGVEPPGLILNFIRVLRHAGQGASILPNSPRTSDQPGPT